MTVAKWKVIGYRGGVTVKWALDDGSKDRITITKERRPVQSNDQGGIRYVIRADNVDREYRALTLDDAKSYARFWFGVWSGKFS